MPVGYGRSICALGGIQSLDMSHCNQLTITDAAFVPLAGIKSLDMRGCSQDTITDAAFTPLVGIQSLTMWDCSVLRVSAARALGLPVHG